MSLPPAGPVPVRISLRISRGCLTTSAWATMPPSENEKMSTVSYPSAVMNVYASSAIASTVPGTLPVDAPSPRLSNAIT